MPRAFLYPLNYLDVVDRKNDPKSDPKNSYTARESAVDRMKARSSGAIGDINGLI
jgi:hypothetical protein